ncbi:MAG TPA: hypothetical protein VNB29_01960, partial [Chthoniobacterales bacterium]|nr:hypothetical protein [Chthoniobacterales bacterium]
MISFFFSSLESSFSGAREVIPADLVFKRLRGRCRPKKCTLESGISDGFYKLNGVGATFWSLSRSGTMDRMETSGKYMEAVAVRWPVS